VRPTKFLVLSPICLVLSVYAAFTYAMIYFMISTFTFVFQDNYGFSEGIVGLVFISLGLGMFFGVVVQQAIGNRIMERLANKHNNGKPKPEYRIPPTLLAGCLIPIGLFIYGWTVQYRIQWAVPLLGVVLAGMGICIINISTNLYLVDAFTVYAASALAASAVLRSIFGATFPLFALQMYDALGLGWGNSLLAFIALAMLAFPPLLYSYGEQLRSHPRFQIKL
jgi:MFS family permease